MVFVMMKLRTVDYEIVQNQNQQGKQSISMCKQFEAGRAGRAPCGRYDKFSLLEQALAG